MSESQQMTIEDAPAHEPEIVDTAKTAKSARAVARYEAPPSAVAPWAPSALALLSDEEFDRRLVLAKLERDRIAKIQRAVMTQDVDYGVIPGTDKPTLFKPGAEILNKLAGLSPEFEVIREFGDNLTAPAIRYQVKCRLFNADGAVIAAADGSSNSWERKHRYRRAERICPACSRNTIIKGKEQFGGGWLCWARKGGCGAKFPDDAPEIVGQADQMENPDPHDLDNTLLKMGSKRAMVAATLLAHAASGIFAQDLEDLPPVEDAEAADPDAAQKHSAKRAPQSPPRNEMLSAGKQTLVKAHCKKRASSLGLDPEDAAETILANILKPAGKASLGEVPEADLAELLRAIEAYEA